MTSHVGVAALRPVDAGIPTQGNRAYLAPRTTKEGERKRHNGIDMLAPGRRVDGKLEPVKVRSVSKGVVTHADDSGVGFRGYGPLHVVVKTEDGKWLLYAHLGEIMVRPGDRVKVGSQLGTVDLDVGHLHFEVSPRPYPQRHTQDRLDPVTFLSGDSTATSALPKPDNDQEGTSKPQEGSRKKRPRRGTGGPDASLWGVLSAVVASLVVIALNAMLSTKARR